MRKLAELAAATLAGGRQMLTGNLAALTLDEALDAGRGARSVLGILKHTAAWSAVYYSFAFEPEPRHWRTTDWPRGLRDTIEPTREYLDDVIAWFDASYERWQMAVAALDDDAFDVPYPCHWRATAPLFEIVLMVGTHWSYHAGEINALLALRRGEAWEYTEEVEENHISTAGHRIRPGWMDDAQAEQYEAYLAIRDRQLHGAPDE